MLHCASGNAGGAMAIHNLKRSFERHCADVSFTKDANERLLLFSKDIDIEILSKSQHRKLIECNDQKQRQEKLIIIAARIIRKAILSMKDTLPWPPHN